MQGGDKRTARRYIGIRTNSLSKGRKDIQHVPSTGKIRTVGTFEFWVPKRQSLGGGYTVALSDKVLCQPHTPHNNI